MDDKAIMDALSTDYPVGFGGCRTDRFFDSCEYNVTVFDGKNSPDEIIVCGNHFIKISHGSLDDSDSDVLVNYDQMQAIHDPSWELHMLLSKIKHKRARIFSDYAKNCILNSIFCCTRSREGIGSDVFSSCWQKSALVYLANSILALNGHRPSPSHNLEKLRKLGKNSITNKLSIINGALGIERATPSLLERMCKSTIGFSAKTENNQHSLIIQTKHDYFVQNSMFADCYFYLICTNHKNFIALKSSIHRNPDLIHILKVAFDLENDPEKLQQNNKTIHKASNEILATLGTN